MAGTGNNVRFILEGFLINLEIAVIAMVFALAVGLLLALARALDDHGRCGSSPGAGSTSSATCR